MRSSIACARCRRSKVKCINNGVNTVCKACENTGRECTYPSPAVAGTSRRDATTQGGSAGEYGDLRRQARPRKVASTSSGTTFRESAKPIVDALDLSVLTPQLWTELFEIFQLHYSTDLPFLHPPTFQKPLRRSAIQQSADQEPQTPPTPPASPLLLLSFLALTSRFHPTLIKLHSASGPAKKHGSLAAAEYYASAAKSKLSGVYGEDLAKPDLERTQALLMLGLHEWSMCRGAQAWILVGVAVRTAQILGLQFEQDLDDLPQARSVALKVEAQHMGIHGIHPERDGGKTRVDGFIEQEMRRRTFWSCFIMDRYLSSGKFRPQMLHVNDLRIQLPSSERAFLFGEKVRTSLLGEDSDSAVGQSEQTSRRASLLVASRDGRAGSSPYNEAEHGRWELGQDEGVLSRFIRILDLHGRIVKWSCAGGRRQEKHPPWDPLCRFYQLRKSLAIFKDGLPRDLTLSPGNISAHITSRTSTPYTLMHTLCALCSIILHREYVPFIPIRCQKPQGPLDKPVFSPEEYEIPSGFWEESAREKFQSARELVDLIRMCQEWEVLVETPIIGFAAYTAAFSGIYAINFPWMDTHGHMCNKVPRTMHGASGNDKGGAEAARKALEIVGQMRTRLKMADGWFNTIKRCHIYYGRLKKDFKKNSRSLEAGSSASSESSHQLSLREGGIGGGLEEYRLVEKVMREFGSLEDEDIDMADPDFDTRNILEDGSESGSGAKSDMGMSEVVPESAPVLPDGWQAINSAPSITPVHPTYPNEATSQFRHGPSGVSLLSPNHAHYGAATSYERGSYGGMVPQTYGHRSSLGPVGSTSAQSGPWSAPDLREDWLNNLDTRFGGDDVAAFVEGNTWQEFSGMGGWLGNVWSGFPPTPAGNS